MLNIKQVFFMMIALNAMLVVIFLKTSMHDSKNLSKHLEGLQNDLVMKSHAMMHDHSDSPVETPSEEPQDIVTPSEPISDAKLEDTTEPEQTPVGDKTEDILQNVDTSTGSYSKPVITKDSLAATNEKIKNDPMLLELVKNFKELRKRHQDLSKRYRGVQFQNKKLKKTSAGKNAVVPQNGVAAASKKKLDELNTRSKQVQMVLRYSNPMYLLGAYPNITLEYFNSYPDGRPFYERMNYGLHNDMDYCELTDLYNLAHPENMFKRKTFFTDYAKNGLPRKMVMRKLGYDLSPKISKYMPKRIFKSRSMHLDPRITMFFTKRVDLHIYHEIGKHFLCATQMYNHIPGHGVLKRKDMIVDSVDAYAKRYEKQSHCFNKHTFFPFSYRLYVKEECKAFFKEINSKQYTEKLKTDPIQYIIKIGFGSHRAQGVFLLDQAKTAEVRHTYRNGLDCGRKNQSLIAQTYVTNPLVLDYQNKFDFRIYMLVASTNPLIVYYHDGFLRVSLYEYDKFSNDRSTHLTNTHLSKDIFAEVRERNETLHGMNEEELRNYQMWTLERLQDYLLKSGKISDPNWLNNYLRPKFKEAFIHIVRMTSGSFWKQSNVFEMFGLDFMLDSELNLWFIECNSSPQLIGTNEHKTNFLVKMMKDLFEIQFGYYKSRMKRVVNLIKKMNAEAAGDGSIDYTKWKNQFEEAWKNKFEPEFAVKSANSFELIMDQNIKGPGAYFGYLKDECVDD